MQYARYFIVFFILISYTQTCQPAKVLALFTTFSKSHYIIHKALIDILIERGHNVTIVTTWPASNTKELKYRHIYLEIPSAPNELISSVVKSTTGVYSLVDTMLRAAEFTFEYNDQALHDPQMQRLMAEESFDLVVQGYFFNSFQLGVAAHFKCPVVISFMHKPVKFLVDMIANPVEVFYVPHFLAGYTQPMSFFVRVKNFLFTTLIDNIVYGYIHHKMRQYYNANFPADKYPSFESMLKNVTLILAADHFSNGVISPHVPALIDVGGIQIKPKPDPLREDIKKFLDGASKDGAVYFSLGSNARSADMGSETISMLYSVLAGLNQRVIWKWEEDVTPGNASNILFKRWLPQDDILAHPNVKLFVTHGGHGSVVESEYHGVPMVGMPLFADQFSNMDAVQKAGYGLSLGKGDITEEKFKNAVKEVLENPSYRNKVQEFSRLYRDRPMSARDTAAFWLEYVIRHRGAKHMQSPAVHMNFIQYYGIDVFAFLFAIVYVVFKTIAFVLKRIYRLVFGSKSKKSKKE